MRAGLAESIRRGVEGRRRRSPTERPALPWAKPRFEIALLALVAVAALSAVYPGNTQDVSRLCLAHAVIHGHLSIEPCAGKTLDHAVYRGREYSDKAPGLSFLAVPIVWAVGLSGPPGVNHSDTAQLKLWTIHLVASGLAFLVLAFLVGRVSEGIAPGYGAAALVAFSLGMYVCPLAATTLDHVLAGAFVFGGFLLAWSRRYVLAGLATAFAVDTNYLCGLLALIVAAYVLSAGWRPLLRFVVGAAVPLALLGAYDWAAFGSPFHLSYRYVANQYTESQSAGFFGIGVPNGHAAEQIFVGSRGILVASPVIVAATAGLFLLAKSYRREAIVCGVAFGALLLANCGYFLPYGGTDVGPRFLVPSVPFVALGLAPAFARWFRTTAVLTAVSIVSMATLTIARRQTIWEFARTLAHGKHLSASSLFVSNALHWVGIGPLVSSVLVFSAFVAAYVLALVGARSARRASSVRWAGR